MEIEEIQSSRPEIDYPIHGIAKGAFEAVEQAFRRNFEPGAEEHEIGAAVAVFHKGELVVDMWGGWTDTALSKPWREDTLVGMMSVGKGIGAMVIHLLADRGVLALDEKVAHYWPGFATAGKDGVAVRHVLDHRAGVPVVDGLWKGALLDQRAMADGIARQAPALKPTAEAGYHVLTYGYILSELALRTTGMTIGQILDTELTGPLKAAYGFGLTSEQLSRCAHLIVGTEGTILDPSLAPPGSLLSRLWDQMPEGLTFNETEWRQAEIVSANGHGTARGVAQLYGTFMSGTIAGRQVFSETTIERATSVQHQLVEQVMGRSYRQGLGFVLDSPPILKFAGSQTAYGHHGVGGSVGFADPAAELAFAYAPNRLHRYRVDNGPRAGSLIEAAYAAAAQSK